MSNIAVDPEHDAHQSWMTSSTMSALSDPDLVGKAAPANAAAATKDVEKQKLENTASAPLDWDGPDDPDDPHNWPILQKLFQTFAPATFGFLITLASPIYTQALAQVQEEFNVSLVVALLGISTHTLGFALGPCLSAPISELNGRLTVYLVSMPLFMLFTMATGLAQNIETIIICRFFAGTFGSSPLAVGGGTIADLWDVHKDGGWAAALFIMAPFAGSSLAPVLGGLVSHNTTWRWTMWFVLIVGGVICIQLFFMKETYKPTILKKRAKKRGISLPPPPAGSDALAKILRITLIRPVHMLVTEPIVGYLSFYCAFAFGCLFAFFASINYSFQTQYHFDTRQSGAVFLASFTGVILGTIVFIIIDRTVYKKRYFEAVKKGEKIAPEWRLVSAIVGSWGLPICFFWFAWTCKPEIHWAVPAVSIVFFGLGMTLIFFAAVTYMVDVYQYLTAASALAANGLLRYSFAAGFPLFIPAMYKHMGIDWATSLLGFVSLVLIAVPMVLFKWGKVIRNRSSYDTLKH